jgi:hypothetical protein
VASNKNCRISLAFPSVASPALGASFLSVDWTFEIESLSSIQKPFLSEHDPFCTPAHRVTTAFEEHHRSENNYPEFCGHLDYYPSVGWPHSRIRDTIAIKLTCSANSLRAADRRNTHPMHMRCVHLYPFQNRVNRSLIWIGCADGISAQWSNQANAIGRATLVVLHINHPDAENQPADLLKEGIAFSWCSLTGLQRGRD